MVIKTFMFLLQEAFETPLAAFGNFLFSSLKHSPNLKLTLVMIVVPFFLNMFQVK